MATKGIKRRQKKSAVEAVGPSLGGAYYRGLAAQQITMLSLTPIHSTTNQATATSRYSISLKNQRDFTAAIISNQ
jgi:hypothetical protein